MRDGWRSLTLAQAVGTKGRVFGGPFGSDLTQTDYVADGIPVIRVSNQVGPTIAGDFVYVTAAKAAALASNIAVPGDLIVVQRGSTFGKVSRIPINSAQDRYIICQSQMAVRVDEAELSAEYLFQFLRSPAFEKYVGSEVIQTGQPHLNLEILRKTRVSLPPLVVQKKIANILCTWDDAIEKLEALQTAKCQQQDALAESLIFGLWRTKHGRRDWHHIRLGDVTRELTARNTGECLGRDAVMGVTKANGIVPMRDETIGSDLSRYKILPPRTFAYNPMRINVGSIAMSRLPSDVLVSPDYVLFSCIDGKLSPDYLEHLRKTHFWSHHVNAGGSGSVRMRIYYDDLAAMALPLPDYDEQLAIVEVLDTARREISLIEDEIDALSRQKRGLMQKLLTGEWRVTVGEN